LTHRRADVGELDDIGLGLESELAQLGQIVGRALLRGQQIRKFAQDTGRHRDVTGHHVNASRCGKRTDDGQKRGSRQKGRFVSQGVNNFGIFSSHCSVSVFVWIR
jgi:hypothetical protein